MSPFASYDEERRAAFLYEACARAEAGSVRAELFARLAGEAEAQAAIWRARITSRGLPVPPPFAPDLRTRLVARLVGMLGPRRMRTVLAAMKVRGMAVYATSTGGRPAARTSTAAGAQSRVTTGGEVPTRASTGAGAPVQAPSGGELALRKPGGEREGGVALRLPVEPRGTQTHQRTHAGGGNLRTAVFGVNDGIVSNASLILGVAGAGSDPKLVLVSGIAGLAAGAFALAAGEYVSVRSQRELFERQIGLERDELVHHPEAEAQELALIYAAKGVPQREAGKLARQIVADPDHALDTLAREELGVNPGELGSPLAAAGSSLVAFALGAAVPLLAFALAPGAWALPLVMVATAVALAGVGAVLSLFTGRNAALSGVRMLAIGVAAGALTFGIGRLLGAAFG